MAERQKKKFLQSTQEFLVLVAMASLFTLENFDDFSEKINIDELYEKKKQQDQEQLQLFNKILHRVHVRIRTTSRQKVNNQFCWFVVPEIILGVPKYDNAACIAYLINKLQDNHFLVRYTHPNLLLIGWGHYVPSYVRTEIKKKTGVTLDEFGAVLPEETEEGADGGNDAQTQPQTGDNSNANKKQYTSVKSYKPSGNLLYDEDILSRIEDKFR